MKYRTGHLKGTLPILLTLPPSAILRKIRKRAWRLFRRTLVRIPGAGHARLNHKALVSGIQDENSLLLHIKKGPSPIFFIDDQKKDETAQQFRELCPGEEKNVIRAADQVCQHVFDLLGSGPRELGKDIDWHKDFKSGHRWNENAFYADLQPASYPGGFDIKIPWELSRCQQFTWLGQAYWLSGDEAYALEFCAQVEHWITSNPPQLGVNWVCAMDVGIRAINWLWGYAYFRHSSSLSDEFHLHFYRSMLEHGRHIFHNLEYSEILTSNHYLSNLAGLVYLGFLLPEFTEAQTWLAFGLSELECEMFKQVYPDGTDFEASTNYHRLVTELFLSVTMLAQINGVAFSPEYLSRLERMIEVAGLILRPDGSAPVIGDQDNGRLHRLKTWDNPNREWNDFRPLLAVGAAWLQKPMNIQFTDADWTDAFWLTGPEAVRQAQQMQRGSKPASAGSVLLPDGGWAVLRDHDHYLMVDVGQVGQNGQGGHSHNDSLSLDVFASGQTWIVDPGTYIYTADYEARHQFRLTQMHNTVYIPGYEQSRVDAQSPFQVNTASKTRVIFWETNQRSSLITAEVQFACSPVITHRRGVLFVPEVHAWLVADCVFPEGLDARVHLNFSPGVQALGIEAPFHGVQLSNEHGKTFWVYSLQGEMPNITQGWSSFAYGVKQRSLQADFRLTGKPIHYWALLSEESVDPIESRIRTLQKTWEHILGEAHLLKELI